MTWREDDVHERGEMGNLKMEHSNSQSVLYLYRGHESVRDDAHAQEHIDQGYKVNDGPSHFVPNRGILGIPYGQNHT